MRRLLFLALAALAPVRPLAAEPAAMNPVPVARRALLAADITPARPIARVEIKEVTLAPGVAAGLHLHPCPVVGVVTAGAIAFQLEGGPVRHLRAGDAFCEPAGARVARFDNEGDAPATFAACYLLAAGETGLIRRLEP